MSHMNIEKASDPRGKQFAEGRRKLLSSALSQPSLTSHCDTLAARGNSKVHQQLRHGCKKIDERSARLAEQVREVGKRTGDSWTNLIATTVALVVIAGTEILNGTAAGTLVANLGPIVLNLVLSCGALASARGTRGALREKERILTEEYEQQRWQLDRYDTAVELHDLDEENPPGSHKPRNMSMEKSPLTLIVLFWMRPPRPRQMNSVIPGCSLR